MHDQRYERSVVRMHRKSGRPACQPRDHDVARDPSRRSPYRVISLPQPLYVFCVPVNRSVHCVQRNYSRRSADVVLTESYIWLMRRYMKHLRLGSGVFSGFRCSLGCPVNDYSSRPTLSLEVNGQRTVLPD